MYIYIYILRTARASRIPEIESCAYCIPSHSVLHSPSVRPSLPTILEWPTKGGTRDVIYMLYIYIGLDTYVYKFIYIYIYIYMYICIDSVDRYIFSQRATVVADDTGVT